MVNATVEGIFNGTIVELFRPPQDNGNGSSTGNNGTSPLSNGGSGSPFKIIILTDKNDDTIGSAQADSIEGLKGDDTIEGRSGGDIIFGNQDNDSLLGERGDDSLFGNQDQDTLLGGDGKDTLWGGKDNDSLLGGEDKDILYGNFGNDCLYGDSGDDCLYGGIENDSLLGGEGNDCLYGGQGNDSLLGGEGDDTLAGDKGSDTLKGGDGEDLFIISKNTGGDSVSKADIIIDYNTDENDRIGLINGLRRNDLEFLDTIVAEKDATVIRLRNDPEDFLAIVIGVNEENLDFRTI